MSGQYPNTFYRVSLKALILNEKGEILSVKEGETQWSLPGGGMDHGETPHEALARELYEEVLIDTPFTEEIIYMDSSYLPHKEAWLMWIIYKVVVSDLKPGIGKDAKEIAFLPPEAYKDIPGKHSSAIYELVLKYRD